MLMQSIVGRLVYTKLTQAKSETLISISNDSLIPTPLALPHLFHTSKIVLGEKPITA